MKPSECKPGDVIAGEFAYTMHRCRVLASDSQGCLVRFLSGLMQGELYSYKDRGPYENVWLLGRYVKKKRKSWFWGEYETEVYEPCQEP